MSQLVVLNGSSNIARSVIGSHLARNPGKYASVKLVDARPYRQSVYAWQRQLNVPVEKALARTAQGIELNLEGAKDVIYFTHDYTTMASDKNSHLVACAKLTKKHGIENFVAVCPLEHDLAWSEDEKTFLEKADEAQNESVSANSNMTLLKTNLVFGPQSHLIHFLAQCAIVGKAPYKNLVSKDAKFLYAPVYSEDIASAIESARSGISTLNGPEQLNLRQILNQLELSAGNAEGQTGSSLIPPIDYLWDFLVGTTSDLNMSRMVEFYEENQISAPQNVVTTSQGFSDYYKAQSLTEEDYAHPTMAAYKCSHTD